MTVTPKVIPNYGGLIKRPKSMADGDIPALHIKKLFRMIIHSPSGGGKSNLLYNILKISPIFLHIFISSPEALISLCMTI